MFDVNRDNVSEGCRRWRPAHELTAREIARMDDEMNQGDMLSDPNTIHAAFGEALVEGGYPNADATELQDGAVGDRGGQPVFFHARQITEYTPVARQLLDSDDTDARLSREFYFIDKRRVA